KFYHASTSEIFGNSSESPQMEETAMRPTSPYGCAKAFATQLARVYRQSYRMFVCNGILYNHESPRRGENFVTRKIARAAARISRGLDVDLVLRNLESKRDWRRAQNYVIVIWLMLQHGKPGDYVVDHGYKNRDQFVRFDQEFFDLLARDSTSHREEVPTKDPSRPPPEYRLLVSR